MWEWELYGSGNMVSLLCRWCERIHVAASIHSFGKPLGPLKICACPVCASFEINLSAYGGNGGEYCECIYMVRLSDQLWSEFLANYCLRNMVDKVWGGAWKILRKLCCLDRQTQLPLTPHTNQPTYTSSYCRTQNHWPLQSGRHDTWLSSESSPSLRSDKSSFPVCHIHEAHYAHLTKLYYFN